MPASSPWAYEGITSGVRPSLGSAESLMRRYESVAYRSDPIPECHPARMATVARLRGLDVADPARCDVLDIGCGDATNILSLAAAYPEMRVVGIDPSEPAIERGEALRAEAGLDGARLIVAGAGDAPLDDESMDYVIAHGVISWVDEAIRDEVLTLAARVLRPGGTLLLSYAAYPGAHQWAMARDVGLEAIRELVERGKDVSLEDQTRAAIARVRSAGRRAAPGSPYAVAMTAEAERMAGTDPYVLFHDELSDVWQPFRVTEVARLAGEHGLQYVGELVNRGSLPGDDPLAAQQLWDDLHGCGFHSTLFAKADSPPAPSRPADVLAAAQWVVGLPSIAEIQTPNAAHNQVLAEIVAAQGAPRSIRALAAAAKVSPAATAQIAFELDTAAAARIWSTEPPTAAPYGRRPCASPLVRGQLARGSTTVSSRFHTIVTVEELLAHVLIGLLDGTRTVDQIAADLPAAADAEGIDQAAVQTLVGTLDHNLGAFAAAGVLLAGP